MSSTSPTNLDLSQQFLKTKFKPPQIIPDALIQRPHLIQEMQQAVLRNRLTLVAAPAGSGKTTLLAAWHTANSNLQPTLTTAWLALEESDNEPVRFWSYFVGAVQELIPALGEKVLPLLQNPHPKTIETALTLLLNELETTNNPLAFVLDDYHYIGTDTIHKNLALLIDRLPPNVHLLIATRHDPPLPIPRLRVRQQLFELRATDLRFTLEESQQFFTRIMGLTNLSSENIKTLEAETEGWIAGLQLAALSLRGRGSTDIANYLKTFTGRHHLIQDYLAEEVLTQQNESIQHFLLQTSILSKLNSSLCNAVTSQTNSSRILKELEQANLFLIALDDERQWYRYHHLFAEMIVEQLKQKQPELVSNLHERAANWYEQNGLLTEAVEHYLAAGANTQATRLLEVVSIKLIMDNRVSTALSYLETLSDTILRSNARLCLFYATGLYVAGRNARIESYVEAAEQLVAPLPEDNPSKKRSLVYAACIRAYLACDQADVTRSTELVNFALTNLETASGNKVLDGLVLSCRIRLYELTGDLKKLRDALIDQRNFNQSQGNKISFATDTMKLATAHLRLGNLNEAHVLYQEALTILADNREYPLALATIHLCLSTILFEKNLLEETTYHVQQARELSSDLHGLGFATYCTVMEARLALANGQLETSRTMIRGVTQLEKNYFFPPASLFQIYLIHLWLTHGKLELALDWAAKQGLTTTTNNTGVKDIEFEILFAEILLASGRLDKALTKLVKLEQVVRQDGQDGSLLKVLILQAIGLHDRKQAVGSTGCSESGAVLDKLTEALRLAEPQGYIMTFLDHAQPAKLGELLKKIPRTSNPKNMRLAMLADTNQENSTYLSQLLDAVVIWQKAGQNQGQVQVVSTVKNSLKLTKRQLEILHLIAASDASNQEIADRLNIDLGTVKRHVENIGLKLHISNLDGKGVRYKAVRKAQELNLI